MTLPERARAVRTREDLTASIELTADYGARSTWTNTDLAPILAAMSGPLQPRIDLALQNRSATLRNLLIECGWTSDAMHQACWFDLSSMASRLQLMRRALFASTTRQTSCSGFQCQWHSSDALFANPRRRVLRRTTRSSAMASLNKTYLCPVCGYDQLHDPPRSESGGGSYEICPSCGFEFGVTDDDQGFSYVAWRTEWVKRGMSWSSVAPMPAGWNPGEQIKRVAAQD